VRLFLSYAREDRIRVSELVEVLRAGGFEVSWDDEISPGAEWATELERGIARCEAFLCAISKDATESEWCQWELAQAVALGRPIIPILIRPAAPPLPAIAKLQWLDISAGLRNRDVAQLVGHLARLGQKPPRGSVTHREHPAGLPSRVLPPVPRDHLTVSQAVLVPSTTAQRPYAWQPDPDRAAQSIEILGVDFGTSTSAVAVARGSEVEMIPNDLGEISTPSVVAIASDGTPLVGQRAVDLLMQSPERGIVEVKRALGREMEGEFGGPVVLEVDGVAYSPIQLTAFVLRQLRRDAEAYIGGPVRGAVLGAPAYFDSSQCDALVRAAKLAGLAVTRVIPEPVAACMGVTERGWEDIVCRKAGRPRGYSRHPRARRSVHGCDRARLGGHRPRLRSWWRNVRRGNA
jgi:hypothetical protein